ncbi:MAG: ABC transporter ATP-binding protein [Candidatus Tectimicrobiota bacterium]|nr:MAG: ABC transporter ATP-binding protein [Candidatus Tectomicrobia bacterium]
MIRKSSGPIWERRRLLLEVHRVCAGYGDLQVLWEVSLHLQAGEIVAVIGANGAGKTTLLRTIAGLLRPTAGHIALAGTRLERLPPHRIVQGGVVRVPEGRKIFPRLTVLENLELGAYLPAAKRQRRQSLEWVFGLFPRLKERRRQLAGTLSGGEQQMLAIGRALMARPRLLMLDEPSLGLAPLLVQEIFAIIRDINRDGVTILLVEQHVFHALRLAHRGYVLENGRIVLEGKAEALLANEHVKTAYLGL